MNKHPHNLAEPCLLRRSLRDLCVLFGFSLLQLCLKQSQGRLMSDEYVVRRRRGEEGGERERERYIYIFLDSCPCTPLNRIGYLNPFDSMISKIFSK